MHCTVAGNTAAGGIDIGFQTHLHLSNSIVYQNQPYPGINLTSAAVSYSNIQNGIYPGTGNISEDPLLVDAANSDYHITPSVCVSPCRNAGDPAFQVIPGAELDIDGEPRIRRFLMASFTDKIDVIGTSLI